jgi:hypothetical protein
MYCNCNKIENLFFWQEEKQCDGGRASAAVGAAVVVLLSKRSMGFSDAGT